jgi:hypothetical protein
MTWLYAGQEALGICELGNRTFVAKCKLSNMQAPAHGWIRSSESYFVFVGFQGNECAGLGIRE